MEAGWSKMHVYCTMDPVAQKGLAKEKPWEVMQARWLEEEERMTEEKKATDAEKTLTLGSGQIAEKMEFTSADGHVTAETDSISIVNPSEAVQGVSEGGSFDGSGLRRGKDEEAENLYRHLSEQYPSGTAPITTSFPSSAQPAHGAAETLLESLTPGDVARLEEEAAGEGLEDFRPISKLKRDDLLRQVVDEIMKHKKLICGCLKPTTPAARDERGIRMENIWGTRARAWETWKMTVSDIKEEDLPAPQATLVEMLVRQSHIFRICISRDHPPPEKVRDPRKWLKHGLILAASAIYLQLEILQEWTAYWEGRLPVPASQPQLGDSGRDPPRPAEGPSRPDPERNQGLGRRAEAMPLAPAGQLSSGEGHNKHLAQDGHTSPGQLHQVHQHVEAAGDATNNGRPLASARCNTPVEVQYLKLQSPAASVEDVPTSRLRGTPQENSDWQPHSWQGHHHRTQLGYGHMTQSQIPQNVMGNAPNSQPLSRFGRTNAVSSFSSYLERFHPTSSMVGPESNDFQLGRANNVEGLLSFRNVAYEQPSITRRPLNVNRYLPAAPNARPQPVGGSMSSEVVMSQQPSNLQGPASVTPNPPAAQNARPRRPKRGAPRKVMFPNAPSADQPLPNSALIDEDEILDHFPEHLTNFEVMRRFVRGAEARRGGYPTKVMANKLMRHVNGKDSTTTDENQRRKNLISWIVKEKDSCNAKLRAARSLNNSTTAAASNETAAAQFAATPMQTSLAQTGIQHVGDQQLPQRTALANPQYAYPDDANSVGFDLNSVSYGQLDPRLVEQPQTLHGSGRGWIPIEVTAETHDHSEELLVRRTPELLLPSAAHGTEEDVEWHGDMDNLDEVVHEHFEYDFARSRGTG